MKRRDFLKVVSVCAIAPMTGLEIVGNIGTSKIISRESLPEIKTKNINWKNPYCQATYDKLTFWLKQFQKGYHFNRLDPLEKEVAEGLGLMERDGRAWSHVPTYDAIEACFFVYMEGTTKNPPDDKQYFYGRIAVTGPALCVADELTLKRSLKSEVHDIISEMLVLIKQFKREGKITGKLWPLAYGEEG